MAWDEYRVYLGGKPMKDGWPEEDWIVCGSDAEDALEIAKADMRRNGKGGGGLSVVKLTPVCNHCGYRHRPPPAHLSPDGYCR